MYSGPGGGGGGRGGGRRRLTFAVTTQSSSLIAQASLSCPLFLQMKKELKSMIEQNNNVGIKGLSDMDTRLGKLNRKLGEVEEELRRLDKVC